MEFVGGRGYERARRKRTSATALKQSHRGELLALPFVCQVTQHRQNYPKTERTKAQGSVDDGGQRSITTRGIRGRGSGSNIGRKTRPSRSLSRN
ncbi:hypothetical protein O3P69_015357 [Scylla paramamosain]|uniref:Uncharacterized protein n=1 Tax=Scylla paramamosain TaxID=85552 RepID=A0AAW0T6G3_SCYPA